MYSSRFLIPSSAVELRRVTDDGESTDVPMCNCAGDIGLLADSTVFMWAVMCDSNGK